MTTLTDYLDKVNTDRANAPPRDPVTRVDELLAANNRLEQQARDARADAARMRAALSEVTVGGLDILDERAEQITRWGYKNSHDDRYVEADLARAGAAYALASTGDLGNFDTAKRVYPWHRLTPARDRRFNLVRAGALILAEIDRLDRLKEASGK